MRNTGLVCLQFFVMVLLSCGAGCAPWLSDDFDTYANGNLVGQGGWVGDVGALKVQAGFAQSGKAAEGNCLLWGAGAASRTVSTSAGYHYVDLDAAMDTAGSSYGSNLGFIKFYSSTGAEITRLYYGHQQFKVLLGPSNPTPILDNTGNCVWHHIRLGIDLINSTMDVWVDGVRKVTAGPLYNAASSIAKVEIGQWMRSDFTKTETYVDNLVCQAADIPPSVPAVSWTSPNRYRVLLSANPLGVPRDHSPASVNLDLQSALAGMGGAGTFDKHTVEVIGYDGTGAPRVFDPSRAGYEKYLLPWRIQEYYGISRVTLSFVMPDHNCTIYAVYFDTVESGLGRPYRYPGIVGDGDWFVQSYGRREIGPSKFGDMCDFDGDGDLDLFEGGVEPFVYCYENVGGNRLVERGRLTSGGDLFTLPKNAGTNRAWMTVTLYDWDGDGDQDLFPSFADGPDAGQIVYYRNTTPAGGPITFTRVGQMTTQSGAPLGGGGLFPTPTFVVDWDGDGDGLVDVLVAGSDYEGGRLYLHRNLGPGGPFGYVLADGVPIQAGGQDINLITPRFDVADLDGDGDLDLLAAAHDWGLTHVYWYKNIGSRRNPVFAAPIELAALAQAYPGLKVADFDGDGLPDIAVGTFWKQVESAAPQSFGGLLKNMGPRSNPTFQLRLADSGSLYTEQFQRCDAGQQNGVRALDWDGDGDYDLVASTSGGLLRYFRNLTNNLFPVFAPPQTLMVGGSNPYPVEVYGPESGYARHDMADWNNDGLIDLVVGDEEARVFVFLNDGLGNDPPTFQPGYQLWANGKPLDCLKRGSPLVCDWNNDGKKDLILGMAPKQPDLETPYDWPDQGDGDKTNDQGFLFYKNIGTDAEPVLAYPSWIRAGGQIITYTRPNLGKFVDWDGDGVKDFIGCEFEGNVRFYKNIGSPAPNTEPVLTPAAGTIVVQDYVTTQMISGADVLDFNGDGDLDVLTGQGHGGSGLRFFERDWCDDFVNSKRFPVVTVLGSEQGRTCSQAKSLGDNVTVTVVRGIVSACFDTFFYIQSADRTSGIRVEMPGYRPIEGAVVDVRGVLRTSSAGERYIAATSVTANSL